MSVSGHVLDNNNQPIPFANIKIIGQANGTSTSIDGQFNISFNTEKDSISIQFSCLGYRTVTKKINYKKTVKLNVVLSEVSYTLGDVIVTSAYGAKRGLQSIDKKQLKDIISTNNSIESIVSTLIGVTQNDELSLQYNVRGGSFDENLIYINGINIYRPLLIRSSQQEGLSMINPDLVESLSFSAGGFDVEYDDKLSSVLDIKYHKPQQFELSAKSSLMESRFHLGDKIGNLSYLLGIRYKQTNSLLSTLDTKAEYNPKYGDLQLYASYKISPEWYASILSNINISKYDFVPSIRQTTFGTLSNTNTLKVYFDGGESDYFRTYAGAITLENISKDGRKRQNLSVAGYISDEKESYDISSEYVLNNNQDNNFPDFDLHPLYRAQINSIGINSTRQHSRNNLLLHQIEGKYGMNYQLNDIHRIKFGLSATFNKVSESINEWDLAKEYGYSLPIYTDILPMTYLSTGDNIFKSYNLSSYIVDKFSIQNNYNVWTMQIGGRLTFMGLNRKVLCSPRIRVDYRRTDIPGLSLYMSSGIYYQVPVYREYKQSVAVENELNYSSIYINRSVKAMGAYMFILGGNYDFVLSNRKFHFTSEIYSKYLFDVNPYTVDNLKINYLGDNVGNGYIMGVDMKLFGEFVRGVDSWITLGFMNGKQYIGNLSLPQLNAPTYNISLFYSDYFPYFKPIRLSLRGAYSAGLPFFIPGKSLKKVAFYGADYKRIDMGIKYRISEDANGDTYRWVLNKGVKYIDIGFDVYNLFDITNTGSYYWVRDSHANQWAVPNYLTKRQYNVSLEFGL